MIELHEDETSVERHHEEGGRMAGKVKKDPELDVLAKIAEMSEADRRIAEPLHAHVRSCAPQLTPRLWYSQPAYAREGKVVVFFRGADHDKVPYFTLGFTEHASLGGAGMWPTSYALTALGDDEKAQIAALIEAATA
jgi:hypothetical protein